MTTTKRKKLTKATQRKALMIVASWLGPRMGYDGPAPTGQDEAYRAKGPMLKSDWDWPTEYGGDPTPTILLEGGPYDWAVDASMDEDVYQQMKEIGVFAEPYAGWALCLYPYG